MRPVVVALSGPSAAGKSTVVARLARRSGWAPLAEAYYRLTPRPSLTWSSQDALRTLELRLLAEESRRYLEACSLVLRGRSVIADTPFLDPVGYTAGLLALDQATPATFRAVAARAREFALRGRLGVPDLTVRLVVPTATRRARAAADPARHPVALRARHEAVGRAEARLVVPSFLSALPHRVRNVQALAPAEVVAERVGALAARTTALRDPCGAAVRALDTLLRRRAFRAGAAASGNLKRGTPSPRPPR